MVALVASAAGSINNFRFRHSNSIKGDALPFSAKITGTYYMDWKGTPELSFLRPKADVISATILKESSKSPAVICTGEVGGIIAKMSGDAHVALQNKLFDLSKKVAASTSDADLKTLVQSWDYYVPVDNPAYECRAITNMQPSDTASDNGWTFTMDLTFNSFKTVAFVDVMGVGVFSYKRMYDVDHAHHVAGNPIRFCGGGGGGGRVQRRHVHRGTQTQVPRVHPS